MHPALIKQVTNVHNDDIHGICVVDSKRIISGSKDGEIKLFNYKDHWEKSNWNKKPIFEPTIAEKKAKNNNHWITALDVFNNDSSVLFGRRNSHVVCMDVHSKKRYSNVWMKNFDTISSQQDKHCKQRNEYRITGIKSFQIDNKFTALVGTSQKFYHYDCDANRILGSYTFNRPDWFYGFCQIAPSQIVAIHGCSLSNFSFDMQANVSQWTLIDTFIEEKKIQRSEQKPFISSVMPMSKTNELSNKLALSFFGGKTLVLDTETKQPLHESHEHVKRVWQAVPLSQNEYISCSDDATIKVWDIRCGEASVNTYDNHPGRVSAIAVLDESLFVAGTCPDRPLGDPHKGQFFFYDMRRNASNIQSNANVIEPKNDEVKTLTKELSALRGVGKK